MTISFKHSEGFLNHAIMRDDENIGYIEFHGQGEGRVIFFEFEAPLSFRDHFDITSYIARVSAQDLYEQDESGE
jgi:hypothetical protein